MAGLRERRHQETRELLVDVAFVLFTERGYSNVTMEEVAQAAGVSRSTAYRRFAAKDDVVLEVPRRWLGAFDAAVADLAEEASLTDAVTAATLAVAQHIDEHQATVRAAYSILETAPSLQQSGVATTAWLERFVRLLQDRAGSDAGTQVGMDAEMARTVAGAYLGAIDSMMQHWAMTGGTSSVVESSQRLLELLEPILPAES